jgi:hypothetical protein
VALAVALVVVVVGLVEWSFGVFFGGSVLVDGKV